MQFLIDADLPRSVASLVRTVGHDAIDVRDIGLSSAGDPDIAAHARANQLCLVSADFGFADIRRYSPADYPGLVVLELPKSANEQTILDLVRRLLQQSSILLRLPGRLAIVSSGRVRLRPP